MFNISSFNFQLYICTIRFAPVGFNGQVLFSDGKSIRMVMIDCLDDNYERLATYGLLFGPLNFSDTEIYLLPV